MTGRARFSRVKSIVTPSVAPTCQREETKIMSKTSSKNTRSLPPPSSLVPGLVHRLCVGAVKEQDQVDKLFKLCLTILSSNIGHSSARIVTDEFRLCQRIQKKMVLKQRETDSLRFSELHRRMKSQGFIKNTMALLQFFFILFEEGDKTGREVRDSFLMESMNLPPSLLPSSFSSTGQGVSQKKHHSSTPRSVSFVSSGLGSSWRSEAPSTIKGHHSTTINDSDTSTLIRGQSSSSRLPPPPPPPSSIRIPVFDPTETELPEDVLVQDLLFVFQGIDGKYITMKKGSEGYRIPHELMVHPSHAEHCHKLAELGWLYHKIKGYINIRKQDFSLGLVVQSFLSALSLELTEYYRLVAVLEAQLSADHESSGHVTSDRLSLCRLVVWTREPLEKLRTLAILVDGCKNVRGGALVSTLYTYAQHGDPEVKGLVKHLLNQVYRPINTLLNAWVFEGQLQDHYNEFFILADLKASEDRLWDGKYTIRASMLPKFISENLAKKILTVGKSINFLRQKCHDHTELFNSDQRNWFKKGDCTFDTMTGDPLSSVINITYRETSKYLLNVLNTQYHLKDHLGAFRKYLLLGQGDFIKQLMDIIEHELAKPATSCYVHNLTAILESAIRATNAQYDEQDVLSRLDVQLLDASPGDTGWDVFSLLYRVDGPISTVFTPNTMLRYLQIFNFLWRAKRIEFILAGMWRKQVNYRKQLRTTPDFHVCLHKCQLITGALVHFISQLQYYIMFECLECSWAELLKCIDGAVDLDEVISAHSKFLDVIVTRCLLDPESQPLLTQLRTLFDRIVEYQSKQDNMFSEFLDETEKRRQYELTKENRTDQGLWAETQEDTEREYERREEFYQTIILHYQSEFTILEDSYNDTLKHFLERVSDQLDESLQFLARRLDFNRFYRGTETVSMSM